MANAEMDRDRASGRQDTGTEVPDQRARTVIVGVDGSEAAAHALRWAANKSALFGDIIPTIAARPPKIYDLIVAPGARADPEPYREAARNQLTTTVTAEAPSLLHQATVIDHHPGPGLVDAAADADLLVVGTRGHTAVAAALLGSVSAHCIGHSTTPVAVVPPDWPASRPISTIVVGVDGSSNASRALAWVANELGPHLVPHGRILAVGALALEAYADAGHEPWFAVHEERLTEAVEASVAAATAAPYAGPAIETRLELQDPRVALSRLTKTEGDLLVVGARGASGLGHLLLGSVADALVRHPSVPTIVVPAPRTDETSTG